MGNRSEQLVGGDEPSAERIRNGFDDHTGIRTDIRDIGDCARGRRDPHPEALHRVIVAQRFLGGVDADGHEQADVHWAGTIAWGWGGRPRAPSSMCRAARRVDAVHAHEGLYDGQNSQMTGIQVQAPYEPPEHPELILDTEQWSVEQCVAEVRRVVDAIGYGVRGQPGAAASDFP